MRQDLSRRTDPCPQSGFSTQPSGRDQPVLKYGYIQKISHHRHRPNDIKISSHPARRRLSSNSFVNSFIIELIWEIFQPWKILQITIIKLVGDLTEVREWTVHSSQFTFQQFTPSKRAAWCFGLLEFFLNGAELSLNSVNSEKLINHWSMNWAQFKDPISHMCLAGTVVACWSLTQEMPGWQVQVLLMS